MSTVMRSALLVFCLALGCGSGDEGVEREQATSSITIVMRPDHAELLPGQTLQLKILLNGDGGAEMNGTFSSNNEAIAVVNENTGLVYAIAKGTVAITGHYGPGTAYASITVK
jgi:uncharacterized protein YjdB